MFGDLTSCIIKIMKNTLLNDTILLQAYFNLTFLLDHDVAPTYISALNQEMRRSL